ncbi:hypothetical protein Pcinc_015349 [Petrolisthes cinctipes]|uniref:Uncharacterized protein n=1 Tax=Petrolisthes cinctipes TaxID=88211 RepID=A0AAE1KPV0_PETCI|nr:hypothetical protein Pcinc_015349 [Petrolisthes cinctipes]
MTKWEEEYRKGRREIERGDKMGRGVGREEEKSREVTKWEEEELGDFSFSDTNKDEGDEKLESRKVGGEEGGEGCEEGGEGCEEGCEGCEEGNEKEKEEVGEEGSEEGVEGVERGEE